MLVGRSAEREVLRGLLARAAEGFSGAVVLRGEPGAGKTALLEDTVAAAVAAGLQTARLTGVEPETQLGYAGLHRLLLPFTGCLIRSGTRCGARSGKSPGRLRTGSWSLWAR